MKKIIVLIFVAQLTFLNIGYTQDSLKSKPFFEQFKYTVALVEKASSKSTANNLVLDPIGTAFWVIDTTSNSFVLVSNKHVFGDLPEIILSQYTATGQTSALMLVSLKDQSGKRLWIGHPDSLTDIAALKVKYFKQIGATKAEVIGVPLNLFANSDELIEGDDVFILGFPLGIRTTTKSYPILRSGVLSLKPTEDFLVLPNNTIIGRNIYLVDANILGGNSGSPVFLKPGINRPFIKPGDIRKVTQPKLIGIVSAYVNELLPLVKTESSVYAQGNSGITIVHRAEEILKIVEQALK